MFTTLPRQLVQLLVVFSGFVGLLEAQVLTVQVGTPPSAPTPLVNHGDIWRWRRGTNEPQANWKTAPDAGLDTTWASAPGGFGYGDTIATEATSISGMRNSHTTLYIRRTFQITDAIDSSAELRLVMDYDDGFVIYLDGVELNRINLSGVSNSPVAFNADAPADHEASCCSSPNPPSTFNLGAAGSRLSVGTHVLAFIGLNDTIDSSDMHIIPDFSVAPVQGSSGIVNNGLYTLSTSNTLVLTGTNTIAGSTRVTVNGDDASFNPGSGTWTKTHTLSPGMNRLFIAALDNAGNLLSSVSQEVVYEANSVSISGVLGASTTWNDPATIIHVANNTFIPAGGSLTIGPGVVVILPANTSIIGTNDSVFAVQGTDASPAYFLPVVTNGFGSLTVDGANASLAIRQAHVVAGQVRSQNGAAMLLEDATVRDLPDLSREVVKATGGSSLTMRRVYMTRFSEMDSRDTPVVIEDSLMEGFLVDGADIKATNSPLVVRRTTLRNADPGNSNADGIDFGPGAGAVEDCLIYGFPDKGVSIGGASGSSVRNSLIYNCGVGISCYASTNVLVENTTISLCLTGMFFRANPTPGIGGATNVIVWGNNFDTVITGGSTISFAHSDVAGGVRPGPGNISGDPMFVDAAARDFRLLPGSPASGTGLGGMNMGFTQSVGGLPPAPFNLAAISLGTNFVSVQWQEDAANEAAFLLERSTDALLWEQVGSVAANTTNFVDTTGLVSQKYYYRARATNDSGVSHISNIASGIRQPPVIFVGGTIAANVTWPIGVSVVVTGNVAVAAGVTVTIEPGVNVLFNQGFNFVVNGLLIAEGTAENHIIFKPNAGATTWGALDLFGVGNTHRLVYCDLLSSSGNIDATSTAIYLDHIGWTNTTAQLVDCVSSSLTLLDSYIPGNVSGEPVHFSTMPANGYAVIKGNVFGAPSGYNDNADLTGGNRPGPILQLIDNVFLGSPDDCLDLDATDAHIEGNIFMNVHQSDYRPSSANAIALGEGSGTSEAVVVRNIFYNCDHAMLLKDFGSAVFENNTVVTIQTNQFSTNAAAYLNFGEPHRTRPGGRGILLNGNILWDLHSSTPFLNFSNSMFMVANQNIIQGTNITTGLGNSTSDPLFVNWQTGITYQNIKSNLALLPGSPAIGTGPNGLDRGALVPSGASISGEPNGVTTNRSATLKIGGPGVYAYRWKLNDGPWSIEVSLTNNFLITATMFDNASPIVLNNLTNSTYTVYVVGKNSAGFWQDTNSATISKTWSVGTTDTDGDGIPDDWEISYDFDENDPGDATADGDLDGMNNLQEFLAGTNPTNSLSRLAINIEVPTPSGVPFQFDAQSNKSYTVQYRTSFSTGTWLRLQDFAPAESNRTVAVTNSPADPARFFRVTTPQQP
ncbi:MAG TPA: right-handed parallel beta-helix repeat-containing protein [Candidatus Acidoferrum sp.]|nr:right-handed parallel beta-helix repeat-containing protein [Candidatus Acidoferrum sp.]